MIDGQHTTPIGQPIWHSFSHKSPSTATNRASRLETSRLDAELVVWNRNVGLGDLDGDWKNGVTWLNWLTAVTAEGLEKPPPPKVLVVEKVAVIGRIGLKDWATLACGVTRGTKGANGVKPLVLVSVFVSVSSVVTGTTTVCVRLFPSTCVTVTVTCWTRVVADSTKTVLVNAHCPMIWSIAGERAASAYTLC